MTSRITASAKKFLLPVVLIAGGMALPAIAPAQPSEQFAQTTGQDSLRAAATALNTQRGDLFQRRDAAGVAAIYTPDATYVELLPKLQVMRGRAQIQSHFQELIDARASSLSFTVTSAEMTGNDTAAVGGDYTLTAGGGKQIKGHFFQLVRRDGPTWKIALHVFARPDPVTVGEADPTRGN